VIVPAVGTTALFFLFAVGYALKAQKRKPTTGSQGIIGETGVTLSRVAPKGTGLIHGEYWTVECDEPVEKGEHVKVVDVVGLTLRVERIDVHTEPREVE
jgi:membrane-bound serine protease (ClpP class)